MAPEKYGMYERTVVYHVYTKINFPEPMPHENKFPERTHAENKLSVQTKFENPFPPPPPPLRSNSRPLTYCVPKAPMYNR